MQAFDSTRHNHLFSIRSLLQSWWSKRPFDVIGLTLYGSRVKKYAEQYTDWDIVRTNCEAIYRFMSAHRAEYALPPCVVFGASPAVAITPGYVVLQELDGNMRIRT